MGTLSHMTETSVTSEERKAHNEALFRQANESVRRVQEELGMPEGLMPFICECEDEACRAVVRMTQAEYEAIRAHARRFLIVKGHAATGGHFVEKHAHYCVVEKDGVAGAIAEATNPRAEQ